MNERSSDPLDELRNADPVRLSRSPSESQARVWARIEEVTMEDNARATRGRSFGRTLGLGAAAAAIAVAAIALAPDPTTAPDPTDGPGAGIGSCVEQYSPETLASRDFAFDGTVSAIDGDQVTFTLNQVFAGSHSGSAVLTATGMTGTSISSAGGPTLEVGERYLVAGDEQFAWGCGFTQPYDASPAVQWAEAAR